jgi:hypothetical protein
MTAPLTITTLYRSGGEYKAGHVDRLAAQVAITNPSASFVVLSDAAPGPGLFHNWPRWWGKLELFRGGLWHGPVVYLDLDTDVIGDLNRLVSERFTMLSDFNRPKNPASGVMAWTGDGPVEVYWPAYHNPERMARYNTGARWGDQGWIRDHINEPPERFPPHLCVSYKVHCRRTQQVPEGAVVVCYHGKPRPWHTSAEWADKIKEARARWEPSEPS